jgi:hypothetical protein
MNCNSKKSFRNPFVARATCAGNKLTVPVNYVRTRFIIIIHIMCPPVKRTTLGCEGAKKEDILAKFFPFSLFGWHINSARLASFYLFPLT